MSRCSNMLLLLLLLLLLPLPLTLQLLLEQSHYHSALPHSLAKACSCVGMAQCIST
jgi:hypothetical protein